MDPLGDYPIIIKNNIQRNIYPNVILVDDQRIEGGVGFASQHITNDSKVPVYGIWGYVMVPIEG